MRRCTFEKADGKRCKAPARAGGELCFFHDPKTKKARGAAQARGGRRRTRDRSKGGPKKASKKKDEVVQTPPADAQEDVQTLDVIEGASLSESRLEEILATAVIKGVGGQLSAPVISNITKLISIYENFLARKRDRSDVEKVKNLTTEELHAAMLAHLSTPELVAEVKRRVAEAKKKRAAKEKEAKEDGRSESKKGSDNAAGGNAAAGGNPAKARQRPDQTDRAG